MGMPGLSADLGLAPDVPGEIEPPIGLAANVVDAAEGNRDFRHPPISHAACARFPDGVPLGQLLQIVEAQPVPSPAGGADSEGVGIAQGQPGIERDFYMIALTTSPSRDIERTIRRSGSVS